MKPASEDPWLRIARIALTGALGLSVMVGIGAIILIVLLLLNQDYMTARLASNRIDGSALPWLAAMLALIAAIAGLALLFVRDLRAIVATVSQAQPFIPLNADRLRRMAWLVLAAQALAIPMTRLVVWFDAAPAAANVYHNRNGVSVAALILALILFVLARVFREGTRLRDDVESIV